MLSKEDRALIKMLRVEKGYSAKRLMAKFPRRNWSLAAVKRLLRKTDATGSADRKTGSGRRRTARTDGNVNVVEELALSQENAPGTHRTVRQIARETGITKSSVNRIIHRDLKLKCFKKEKAQDLTEANKNNNKKQKKFKKSCSESTLNTLFHSYGSQTKSCFMLHHQSTVKMIVSMPRPEPGKNNCQPTGFCENARHFQSQ